VTIGVEWVVLDGAFKDKGGPTSSSSGWVVCVVGGVSGNADVAFPSEVCFGDEHDVYVMCIQKQFEFVSMLYEAVGVPDDELKEFCPYWGLGRTVMRRFNKVTVCSMRPFIMVLSS
jgi:hypothetical protein